MTTTTKPPPAGCCRPRGIGQDTDNDAHAGKFSVLVVWALARIVREGAQDALRIFGQFRQRGCVVVPVRESWLNSAPQLQDVLIAFAGWMAGREPARKSERIKAGLAKRAAQDKPPARRPGSKDAKARKRSGCVAARQQSGARRGAADRRGEQT